MDPAPATPPVSPSGISDARRPPRPPRLLLGATLVFWGALIENPTLGLLCGLLLEARNWTSLRWSFTPRSFVRAWHLSVLLMIFAGVLLWMDNMRPQEILRFFRWLPVLLMPVALAQQFNREPWMPLNTFSFFSRRKFEDEARQGMRVRPVAIHFGFPYIAIVLLSAAIGMTHNSPWFLPGMVAIAAIGLWSSRAGEERRPLAWALALLVAGATGFSTQWTLGALKDWALDRRAGEHERRGHGLEPTHVRTMIGNLGGLKQSPEILWRLEPISGPVPTLLRLATYNTYRRGSWRYERHPEGPGWEEDFDDMPGFGAGEISEGRVVRREDVPRPVVPGLFETNLRGAVERHSLFPIPDGVRTFLGIRALEFERNSLGTIRIAPEHAVADTRVLWGEPRDLEVEPWSADLEVPEAERAAVARVVDDLGLREGTTEDKVNRVRSWFFREFSYTRYLSIRQPEPGRAGGGAISTFLTSERRGHCEYFATAAALLLREAGVPTRYAVGFAVMEQDLARNEWVVRGTHAHSWARVWFDEEERWKNVDVTPPSWPGQERVEARNRQPFLDFLQRLREDLLVWRTRPENLARVTLVVSGIGVLLLGYVGWRLTTSRQFSREKGGRGKKGRPLTPLHALEPLARRWLGHRPPGLPLGRWLAALPAAATGVEPILREALALHRRQRFDPTGLESAERDRLRELAVDLRRRLKRRKRR